MTFPFTEDHDMIREAARGFLQDWYDGGKGPERISESGTGFDKNAWKSFSQELGMAGIAVDEDLGGAGLGDLGRVLIMEEVGGSLCSMPFLATSCVSTRILTGMDAPAHNGRGSELLESIALGQSIVTYFEATDAFTIAGGQISGQVNQVLDASHADIFLFTMKNGDALSVFDVQANANGVSVDVQPSMDPTRSYGSVAFDAVNVTDLDVISHISHQNLRRLHAKNLIGIAAECVGGAQACLDMTLEYAAQRVQFGRPISSFQAIKHRCADMFIKIEAARSAVYAAALASEEEKPEAALIAKAYATDAFFDVAGDAIQLHGGIGFTWEYPLHYFFKRARANRAVFGASTADYARLANQIFEDAA